MPEELTFAQQVAAAFTDHRRAVIKAELTALLSLPAAEATDELDQRAIELLTELVGPFRTLSGLVLGLIRQLA